MSSRRLAAATPHPSSEQVFHYIAPRVHSHAEDGGSDSKESTTLLHRSRAHDRLLQIGTVISGTLALVAHARPLAAANYGINPLGAIKRASWQYTC